MKETTPLDSNISAVTADTGHTDALDAVLSEMCVERVVLAEEIKTASPEMQKAIPERFDGNTRIEYVPHEAFNEQTADAGAVVRTGECTPYANVLPGSGVTF